MDVVNTEELQAAIDLLSPAARHELTAMVYRVRWEASRKEVDTLRHVVAVHEENARLERPPVPAPPTEFDGSFAATKRVGREKIADAAQRAAAVANGETE